MEGQNGCYFRVIIANTTRTYHYKIHYVLYAPPAKRGKDQNPGKKNEYDNKEGQRNRPRIRHNCAKTKIRVFPLVAFANWLCQRGKTPRVGSCNALDVSLASCTFGVILDIFLAYFCWILVRIVIPDSGRSPS